jgi:hypothetical protein
MLFKLLFATALFSMTLTTQAFADNLSEASNRELLREVERRLNSGGSAPAEYVTDTINLQALRSALDALPGYSKDEITEVASVVNGARRRVAPGLRALSYDVSAACVDLILATLPNYAHDEASEIAQIQTACTETTYRID